MKKILIILTLCLGVFVSCIEDDSILLSDIGEVKISGIEEAYTAIFYENFKITPDYTFDGVDESKFTFYWLHRDRTGAHEADTLYVGKNLDVTMPGDIGNYVEIKVHVVNKENNTTYVSPSTIVSIGSHFQKGWLILSDKDDHGYLSFISESNTESPVYRDLYGNFSNTPMPKGKYLSINTQSDPSYIGVVLKDSPEKSFVLDGGSMSYLHLLSEEFKNMEHVEGPFKPVNNHSAFYGHYYCTMANGKIYTRASRYGYTESYYSIPAYGGEMGYEVKDLIGFTGRSDYVIGTYDYKNKRYIFLGRERLNVRSYSTPDADFDMGNVDVEPVWMGKSNGGQYKLDDFLSVVKNPETGGYQLHQIFLDYWYDENWVWGLTLKNGPPKLYNFPVGMIDENTCFGAANNMLYFSKGAEIYRVNLVSPNPTPTLIATMPDPVTFIGYDSDYKIAVATNSGDSEFPGDFYIISTATEDIGTVLESHKKVGGVIVDMEYNTTMY